MNHPPTTVRDLVKSVSPLARHLKVSKSAVYRWMGVNRIPGEHLIKTAAYYKYEPTALLHLTGSDKTNNTRVIFKSRAVLAALLEVYKGQKSFDQAVTETGQSKVSLTLIMKCWKDRLPTLYTTLEQLDQGRIDLDEASKRLNVTKSTMHGIRRKYGYCPGHPKAKDKPDKHKNRRYACLKAAMACVAGHLTVKQAAIEAEVCERTIMRAVAKLSVLNVQALKHLPAHVRAAYVADISQKDGSSQQYDNLESLKRGSDPDATLLLSRIRSSNHDNKDIRTR